MNNSWNILYVARKCRKTLARQNQAGENERNRETEPDTHTHTHTNTHIRTHTTSSFYELKFNLDEFGCKSLNILID